MRRGQPVYRIAILAFFIITQLSCAFPAPRFRSEQSREPVYDKDAISSAETSNLDPGVKRLYKSTNRATKEDFIDHASEEGSLWASNGQTNYYFTKNRIRNPGDIITLVIDNDLYKDIGMEVRETLAPKEKAIEMERLREKYLAKFVPPAEPGAPAAATPSPSPSPSPDPASAQAKGGGSGLVPELPIPKTQPEMEKLLAGLNLTNLDIYTALQLKVGDKMMGEVVERYPNGNYKIRASKRVAYDKGPPRTVTVTGVVKASDIEEETDSINSGKLYEYRVEVSR